MKILGYICSLGVLLINMMSCSTPKTAADLDLVPYPFSVESGRGVFEIAGADFYVDPSLG